MPPSEPLDNRTPSTLWLWGFWAFAGIAAAASLLSLYTAAPVDRFLRAGSGVLFLVGGVHQSRVVAYKRATRAPYSTYAPDSLLLQRQAGWSAAILGVVLIASALVPL